MFAAPPPSPARLVAPLLALLVASCGGAPKPVAPPTSDGYAGAELHPTSALAADVSVVSALPRPLRVRLDGCSELYAWARGGALLATADAGTPEATPIHVPKGRVLRLAGARHVDVTATADGVTAVLVLARKDGAPWATWETSRTGACAYGRERDATVAIIDPEGSVPQPSLEGALTTRYLAGGDKRASVDGAFAEIDLLQGKPELRVPEHTHASDELLYVDDGDGTLTVAGASEKVKGGAVLRVPRGSAHALATTPDKAFFGLRVWAPIPK